MSFQTTPSFFSGVSSSSLISSLISKVIYLWTATIYTVPIFAAWVSSDYMFICTSACLQRIKPTLNYMHYLRLSLILISFRIATAVPNSAFLGPILEWVCISWAHKNCWQREKGSLVVGSGGAWMQPLQLGGGANKGSKWPQIIHKVNDPQADNQVANML